MARPKKYPDEDLSGIRFHRLLVIRPEADGYLAQCDCGTRKIVARRNLVSGHTKSCGCLRKQAHFMFCRDALGKPTRD